MRREKKGNAKRKKKENPIGNAIGNTIGNSIGNSIGHPIMLLAPFGLQLGRVRIQDLPKRYPKGSQKRSKNPPGPHGI